MSVLCSKNDMQAPKKFILNFFFNFKIFRVFLVKELNITLVNQNRDIYILYKKKFKIEQHPTKTF